MSREDSAQNLKRWADNFDFKISNQQVEPRLPFMREGTKLRRMPINFLYQQGGMGDYIAWSCALQWLVKNAPWVDGRVWAPEYFIEFARYLFDDAPGWKVYLIDDFGKFAEFKSLIRAPSDQQPQLINAVGASLLNLGFMYFANLEAAPEGVYYPELKLHLGHLPRELKELNGQYAVFTPGGTTHARLLRGRHINPLIRHAKSLGLTPVILGKHQLADIHKSYFADDLELQGAIDLREKTTLFQAAAAMKYAKYTFGYDNGLIHLAACTDATIIAGYNMEHPDRRRPVRRQGKWAEVTLTQDELSCIHCEKNIKLVCYHNFKNCFYEAQDKAEAEAKGEIYDTPKCTDILFSNDAKRFKDAIERLIT